MDLTLLDTPFAEGLEPLRVTVTVKAYKDEELLDPTDKFIVLRYGGSQVLLEHRHLDQVIKALQQGQKVLKKLNKF